MDNAKQGLKLLSTILKAAPIPEHFKLAVTAIPDIALQIIEIVDGVKGNVAGAEALAVHIALKRPCAHSRTIHEVNSKEVRTQRSGLRRLHDQGRNGSSDVARVIKQGIQLRG
ncbi:hypothetical protein FRB95_002529 [Tulasnella sp. JGI-2019a]|nr:hypothetical protein FRB95_002529 [Tulasnella sp. JGI-2019a]